MTQDQVLGGAKETLTNLLADFKKKEKQIGEELKKAEYDSLNIQQTIGKCPKCNKGTLKIRKGKYGNFIGCDAYPDCKTIFSLPHNALVKPSKNICKECNYPKITIIRAKKSPMEVCINPECRSRETEEELNAEKNGLKAYPEEGMECPACKKGKMVLRKSFYGSFLGCNNYPTCRTMMKIVDGKVNTTAITSKGPTKKTARKKARKKAKKKNSQKSKTQKDRGKKNNIKKDYPE